MKNVRISEGEESTNSTEHAIKVETSLHADLVLHLLAHMDIGRDCSSLYDPEYTTLIATEKLRLGVESVSLVETLKPATAMIEKNSQLSAICFVPFWSDNFKDFLEKGRLIADKTSLLEAQTPMSNLRERFFNSSDSSAFLEFFLSEAEREWPFYKVYWEDRVQELKPHQVEFEKLWIENIPKVFGSVMKDHNKGAVSILCLSLMRCGRGIGTAETFRSAVKFPKNPRELLESFFWSVHEMTHQFSDSLLAESLSLDLPKRDTRFGSSGFELHMLLEKCVNYSMYLLFKNFASEKLVDFLKWVIRTEKTITAKELDTMSQKALQAFYLEENRLDEKAKAAIEHYLLEVV